MPLFEYLCEDCGVRSEVLVRGGEPGKCPECGSGHIVKQASAFAPLAGHGARDGAAPPCGADAPCCQDGACPLA